MGFSGPNTIYRISQSVFRRRSPARVLEPRAATLMRLHRSFAPSSRVRRKMMSRSTTAFITGMYYRYPDRIAGLMVRVTLMGDAAHSPGGPFLAKGLLKGSRMRGPWRPVLSPSVFGISRPALRNMSSVAFPPDHPRAVRCPRAMVKRPTKRARTLCARLGA